MVHSGVHGGISVGQNQLCLTCWKRQFWLSQLGITGWLSVHPTLFRWVLLTGCLWVALFFPVVAVQLLLPSLATQLCSTMAGRHLQNILCCFSQIHTLEGIFGSITIRTNSQVDLHLTKSYFQRQEERRPSFRVQSWDVACPALGKESLHLSSSLLSWENKASTGHWYSAGLRESCGLEQSC